MIALIENGKLKTNLDAAGFELRNIGAIDPIPGNLVSSDDPRLTNARPPLPGSVTNASVAGGAGIVQSKLNLDGVIPPAWLGTTNTKAAQGDLVEYIANKNQPNGYAGLDIGGKILAAKLPATTGTGTITSIGLAMPAEFTVSGSPVTGAGTLTATWAVAADKSWFGRKGGAGTPQFYTTPLPVELIPDLDTVKVTSGIFDPARLPAAVGLGGSHAPGAVPDTGDGSGGALATDYLARDASWKVFPAIGPAYQPTVATPTSNASTNPTGDKTVSFASTTVGVLMFYSFTSASAGFQEVPPVNFISLPPGDTVWFYASRAGYNNSSVQNYTNPNP